MGWYKDYENALITVWECDTCNFHSIIQHKRTGKELWIDKEGMKFKERENETEGSTQEKAGN